jgi:hypothetical protein
MTATRLPALLVCLPFLAPAALAAAEPEIRNLDVRGLQIGATTTLVVDGDNLGTAPRLLLPFAAKQTLKPGATANRATFDVALDGIPQPGYYYLRIVTDGGVSLPVVIAVDRLPQRPLAVGRIFNPSLALHGTVTGSTIVSTTFTGKARQKLLIEVEAQRLGSRLRPIVHLYNAKRRQLAWAWTRPALSGDTRLEATLPEDGTYTVSVHDAEYAGAAPGFFRLKIGQWSFVDQVFPPVIGKDHKTVDLLGSTSPVRLDLPASRDVRVLPLAWPKEGTWSGPRPFVRVSSHAEMVAVPGGKVQPLPAGPVGVSGRLLKPHDEDRYRIPVKPGSRIRLEVFAERLGSPLDTALVVRNEMGGELARAEDSPGTLDPVLEYTVPAKVTSIVVGVVDSQGQGGPRGVYRLTVSGGEPSTARADFRLLTPAQRIVLPVAGRSVIPVLIDRRGYQGSVELSAQGLPAGTKLEGTTIPAGADGTLVTIHRSPAAGDAVITHWRGRSPDGQERSVLLRGSPLEQLQPWLATELALAPTTAKASDFQVDWRSTPADTGIVPARKLTLPVKLTRPASASVVRLTLLTSQSPPLVNGQPNPALTLRPERPVELAAKVIEGDFAVLVPPDLPAPSYDVAIQADLLAPDRRTVLATTYTPVKRLTVRMPLVLRLDGPSRIEVKLDPKTGASFDIKGKVERYEGVTGDVPLTLTGLPPGGRATPVNVKAGTSEFTLKVMLPPNVPVGMVLGLKLAGTVAPDPKLPGIRVRSRDVELTLAIATEKKS